MITLKDALKLPKEEIKNLISDLRKKIEENKEVGAYVEQLTNEPINEYGEGVPLLIKDNIQVKGWSVTCASKILQGYVAPYNANVIENLASARIAPFGRANMDEFAMGSSTETSFYGRTLNPCNRSRVPGGSSGGSAAAVAGGFAIAALGSDTGGSIRQPAAFCGCVGLKPAYGRVSRYGLASYSSSLDQIGPITQNVEDAAILFDAIAGFDPRDSTSADMARPNTAANLNAKRKFKIAAIDNYIEQTSPDVAKALEEAIKALEKAGHTVVKKKMGDCAHHVATYYVLATAEASANYARYDGIRYGFRGEGGDLREIYRSTRSQGFGDEVKRRLLLGAFVLSSGYYDAYYRKAQKTRKLISDEFAALHKEFDLIFAPVTPGVAFEFNSGKSPLEMYLSDIFTISVNLAGLPAISLPVGRGESDLPVGAQLIGKPFDEQAVLDAAFSLETAIT
ncbi:MAG: Asp-tRNA(Asn)/Glu-tRNA(Gln) amidotransferase subunit GatA [Helicobacteraceae bacterium]|nr:Asp-tRNA(Asn)/Glu-tRNA(Gln) amidotransferase subunit GatA [Helicobacteraceae bacterium]